MRVPHVNHICIAGRLVQDPVLRKTPSGVSAGDFRLAADDSYTDKEGNRVDRACFLTVKTWGKTTDLVQQYVGKGDPVLVEGALAYETWESKAGERRSRLIVRAQNVQFLKPRPAVSDASAEPIVVASFPDAATASAEAVTADDAIPF